MPKAKEKETLVTLLPLEKRSMLITLKGDSPLLVHKFGERQKEAILNKQTRKSSVKKARDPLSEIEECIYRMEDGQEGFPTIAFKIAMVEVAPYLPGLDKKKLRGAVHMIGDLTPITFKKRVVNESTVKINRGMSGEVRFRPEYKDWSCQLRIDFNESLVSPDQIINALNYAGFHIGVGDWRPQCSGSYGRFSVKGYGPVG
jgi:hypothetical protein